MKNILRKSITVCLFALLVTGLTVVFAKTVGTQAASPKLSASKKTIEVGEKFTLKLKNATAKKVTWKSSKKSVAKVSSTGVVTGVKKGKATITATYKSKKYKCTVTVKKASAKNSVPAEWADSLVTDEETKKQIEAAEKGKKGTVYAPGEDVMFMTPEELIEYEGSKQQETDRKLNEIKYLEGCADWDEEENGGETYAEQNGVPFDAETKWHEPGVAGQDWEEIMGDTLREAEEAAKQFEETDVPGAPDTKGLGKAAEDAGVSSKENGNYAFLFPNGIPSGLSVSDTKEAYMVTGTAGQDVFTGVVANLKAAGYTVNAEEMSVMGYSIYTATNSSGQEAVVMLRSGGLTVTITK